MNRKVGLFTLGGHGFALAVEQIDQIVSLPRVFALPLIPPGFQGVFLFRDEAVPLLDLVERPGFGRCPAPSPSYAVVLQTEAGRVGVPADEVQRIVGREQGAVKEASDGDEEGGERRFVFDGTSVPFLDMEFFIADLPDGNHPDAMAEGPKED